MPGFFEALDNFKNKEVKKHTVMIQGESVEVSLEQKLEIQQSGENAWMLQKGPTGMIVCRKPIIPKEQRQTELTQAEKGMTFYEHNPFWPMGTDNKGYTWQIK
jgi:hypothetical protein